MLGKQYSVLLTLYNVVVSVQCIPFGPVNPLIPFIPFTPSRPCCPSPPSSPGAPVLPVCPLGPFGPLLPGTPRGPLKVYHRCSIIKHCNSVTHYSMLNILNYIIMSANLGHSICVEQYLVLDQLH